MNDRLCLLMKRASETTAGFSAVRDRWIDSDDPTGPFANPGELPVQA